VELPPEKLGRWNAKDIKDDPNKVKIKDKVIEEGATMAELGGRRQGRRLAFAHRSTITRRA
jgi:hypothetical protein